MPWDRNRPTAAKYRSPEHRAARATLARAFKRDGFLICQAVDCLLPTRVISNPNGNADDGLTAGHMPDGVSYNGPEHRKCNIREAAVRANRRRRGLDRPRRWVV